MTPQNAGKEGRKIWKQIKEGKLERINFGELKDKSYSSKDGFVNFIDYEGRTWAENKRIVAGQIMKYKYERDNSPLYYNLPDGLTENELKICTAIMTREHIHPVTKAIRYGNGRTMDTADIGKLAGLEGTRKIQRAVKGLVDKGVFEKVKRGEYRANPKIFKKVS